MAVEALRVNKDTQLKKKIFCFHSISIIKIIHAGLNTNKIAISY